MRQRLASCRTGHKPHARPRPYVLRGVLLCGICQRKMTGNWNNDEAYYRCRFPAEYALANQVDHPRTVYLREADLVQPLDEWLASAFAPARLDAAIAEISAHSARDTDTRGGDAVRARIREYDRKIAQYRASLDAGGDPAVIGPWIAETQARKVADQAQLRAATGRRTMTGEEITAMATALGNLVQVVHDADPEDKAELYAQLGLTLTYQPERRLVEATVTPRPNMCNWSVSEERAHP